MPKKIDYPRASFRNALELAQAVQALGGKTTPEVCADKMSRSAGSGGFNTIVSAAVKFGLVKQTKGFIEAMPIVKSIKLAYDEDEKARYYTEAFLTPPVFKNLVERFAGEILPIEVLAKMLAKEFDVDMNASSAIAKQFIEGAKFAGLLSASNEVAKLEGADAEIAKEVEVEEVPQLQLPYYDAQRKARALDAIQDIPKSSYELVNTDSERRKSQISLTGKRVAELSVPVDITAKDIDIIKLHLDALRLSID